MGAAIRGCICVGCCIGTRWKALKKVTFGVRVRAVVSFKRSSDFFVCEINNGTGVFSVCFQRCIRVYPFPSLFTLAKHFQ